MISVTFFGCFCISCSRFLFFVNDESLLREQFCCIIPKQDPVHMFLIMWCFSGGLDVPISEVDDEIASAFNHKADAQVEQLLLPLRFFCSRRGVGIYFKQVFFVPRRARHSQFTYINVKKILIN